MGRILYIYDILFIMLMLSISSMGLCAKGAGRLRLAHFLFTGRETIGEKP